MAVKASEHPEIEPGMKWCSGCKTAKPIKGGFYKNRTSRDGLAWWCKECANSYGIEYGKRYRSQPGYKEYKASLDCRYRYRIVRGSDY